MRGFWAGGEDVPGWSWGRTRSDLRHLSWPTCKPLTQPRLYRKEGAMSPSPTETPATTWLLWDAAAATWLTAACLGGQAAQDWAVRCPQVHLSHAWATKWKYWGWKGKLVSLASSELMLKIRGSKRQLSWHTKLSNGCQKYCNFSFWSHSARAERQTLPAGWNWSFVPHKANTSPAALSVCFQAHFRVLVITFKL